MDSRAITAEQSAFLHRVLSDVLVQAQADAVFVCDTGGNIIDDVSSTNTTLEPTIAALAAGSFAATSQLAKLLGETSFQAVYHRGEVASIYIQGIGKDFIILVIFGKSTTVGMIKLYVEKASHLVHGLLEKVSNQTVKSSGMKATFSMNTGSAVFDR